MGTSEEDIQINNFSLYSQQHPHNAENSIDSIQENYFIARDTQIIIRDLNQLKTVLDVVIKAGANDIITIDFSIEDISVVESKARQRVIAQDRTDVLAILSEAKVGTIYQN